MPTIQVNGVRLAYVDRGSGPTMLLLHGFAGTAASDMGLLIDEFAPYYRVIAPDLRGYGASRPPNRDFPPDCYLRDAADAAALIQALDCGPVVVLGFSDGGESALLLAAIAPTLVRGVVAWGVCGVITQSMCEAVAHWLPVAAWGPDMEDWREELVQRHGVEQLAPLVEGWVHMAYACAAAGGDIALSHAHLVACPTLLINGAGEVGNPVAAAQQLASCIPGARLEIMPDSGHAVHLQQPTSFLALVEPFVARCALAA